MDDLTIPDSKTTSQDHGGTADKPLPTPEQQELLDLKIADFFEKCIDTGRFAFSEKENTSNNILLALTEHRNTTLAEFLNSHSKFNVTKKQDGTYEKGKNGEIFVTQVIESLERQNAEYKHAYAFLDKFFGQLQQNNILNENYEYNFTEQHTHIKVG